MELSELAKLAYNEVRRYYASVLIEEERCILNDIMPSVYDENYEGYYMVQGLVLNIIKKYSDGLTYSEIIHSVYSDIKNMSTLPWVHFEHMDYMEFDRHRRICNAAIHIFFTYVYANCSVK